MRIGYRISAYILPLKNYPQPLSFVPNPQSQTSPAAPPQSPIPNLSRSSSPSPSRSSSPSPSRSSSPSPAAPSHPPPAAPPRRCRPSSSRSSSSSLSTILLPQLYNCFAASVAERLFGDLPIKDLVSWNTNIAGFAKSETPERALELFSRMLLEGSSPSESTFASVLVACVGVNDPVYGEFIHAKAIKHGLITSAYVGSSLVDFYMKFKRMEDAHILFSEIPDKNVVTWNALISGYSSMGSISEPYLVKKHNIRNIR